VLKQLVQDVEGFLHNDTAMYGLAVAGFCACVGLYYLGEYLFGDMDPELDARLDSTDGRNSRGWRLPGQLRRGQPHDPAVLTLSTSTG
jgi:hypothetical protein